MYPIPQHNQPVHQKNTKTRPTTPVPPSEVQRCLRFELEVSTPGSLEYTRLLRTCCPWVYFRYPTRQYLFPILHPHPVGNDQFLEAES